MNDRKRKKLEKRRREPIHRMLDLVLDINGLGARQREFTGRLPTAFFEFSGQIGVARVRTHSHGWFPYADNDSVIEAHTYRPGELEKAVRMLEEIKADSPGAATPRESR